MIFIFSNWANADLPRVFQLDFKTLVKEHPELKLSWHWFPNSESQDRIFYEINLGPVWESYSYADARRIGALKIVSRPTWLNSLQNLKDLQDLKVEQDIWLVKLDQSAAETQPGFLAFWDHRYTSIKNYQIDLNHLSLPPDETQCVNRLLGLSRYFSLIDSKPELEEIRYLSGELQTVALTIASLEKRNRELENQLKQSEERSRVKDLKIAELTQRLQEAEGLLKFETLRNQGPPERISPPNSQNAWMSQSLEELFPQSRDFGLTEPLSPSASSEFWPF